MSDRKRVKKQNKERNWTNNGCQKEGVEWSVWWGWKSKQGLLSVWGSKKRGENEGGTAPGRSDLMEREERTQAWGKSNDRWETGVR